MGVTILKIISIDPGFVPANNQQQKALELLNQIFRDKEINVVSDDNISFVDQGSNFDDVSCNCCHQLIDTVFGQETMDNAYETGFTDLYFTTPCCNTITSLNDLSYNMPAGFSRFVICIEYPDYELTAQQLHELTLVLSTPIRLVYARY